MVVWGLGNANADVPLRNLRARIGNQLSSYEDRSVSDHLAPHRAITPFFDNKTSWQMDHDNVVNVVSLVYIGKYSFDL